MGLHPKEGQCRFQSPQAGKQLELGAEERGRKEAGTVSHPIPEGSLDLAGVDPLPFEAEVTAEVTQGGEWTRHGGQDFPPRGGRAVSC